MNARPVDSHERWDELAAAYALDALEPDEELEFTTHLRGCELCARGLDEHEFVAAQLGSLATGADDARVPEWSAIRSGVIGVDREAPVSSLAEHRHARRLPRLLGAAAAVLVLAGVGVVTWQATQPSTSPATRAVTACEHRSGCNVVQLHASRGAV